ncbi:glycoside hydrolase family 28 protein [Plicaturopsis crispa FD-325 SS-3]|nr:glycoside hydrolase family 28 protein [Plicaturopsis crispa FD-325 SS-3]
MYPLIFFPLLLLQLVAAHDAPPTPTTATRPTCTVLHTNNADDSPSIVSAIGNCTSNATILFEKNVEYNVWSPIQFAFGENVEINLLGNLNFPKNITAVQAAVASSKYKSGWFLVSGTNISLVGPALSLGNKGGIIRGYGQAWWDAVQQTNRPLLFAWKANNSTVRGITVSKPIGKSFNVAGNGNLFERITIDAKSDSSAFPFNTDAFDAGGDGNTIQDTIVSNGDDCVAIGSPCSNLLVQRVSCTGSHGISVAAKGSDVAVSNIAVRDVVMVDSLYAARYKSSAGNVGYARNISYTNVAVQNVTFPIYVTQNYYDQSQSAPPLSNTSTTIEGLSFNNFAGTINSLHPGKSTLPMCLSAALMRISTGDGSCISDPCWYAVDGVDGTQSVIFDRLYAGTIKSMDVKNAAGVVPGNVGGRRLKPTVICNETAVEGLDVGFVCWDGAYIPT